MSSSSGPPANQQSRDAAADPGVAPTRSEKVKAFMIANSLLLGILCAIGIAAAYPKLGAVYLAPKITATYICVIYIFLLSGISLKTRELVNALKNYKFNAAVQVFNLMVVSSLTYALTRFLLGIEATSDNLAEGLVITSCLPMTINMVIVLTKSSGGDEASAVFNAAFGNLLGVFVTPPLVLMYLGESDDINFTTVLFKLSVRVLLPLAVGQIIQFFLPKIKEFVQKHKFRFKKSQEFALIFIVYTVFCNTVYDDGENDDEGQVGASTGEVFLMIAIILVWIIVIMSLAWLTFFVLYKDSPTLRVFALYGCSHKTIAMGIPLITAMYETSEKLALYTLPILVWHPTQLILGSLLAPRLSDWVEREKERLGLEDDGFTKKEKEEEEVGKLVDDQDKDNDGAAQFEIGGDDNAL
mmetsp:Transcript_9937/g.19819  ORF Transcript_9937/g.19819 Transcript_9937/m.19819 type:complete len:412 (+) Transcript_9937:361-1596(+)|eukprot:CAMPEP_0182473186 /NCGR_PEP_ID=MMETSP1319-20130603/23471_1 /TAXON_ID=172717 /ORGANISM="Bolidomonas pacifica, Strain RCC208" /LENGTH=411 /DNA_ID=CAMNT_0024673951 /DNA_START=254 /DNA_END=1489 /DNA_ORIENTATION=-